MGTLIYKIGSRSKFANHWIVSKSLSSFKSMYFPLLTLLSSKEENFSAWYFESKRVRSKSSTNLLFPLSLEDLLDPITTAV